MATRQGANIYYFRSIFHDWSDHTCRKILLNTLTAMNAAHSRLIIVDFVLSDIETPLVQSSMDIQMMSIGAGVERSEGQWRRLLTSSGFEVQGIWHFNPGMESVIEAIPVVNLTPVPVEINRRDTEKVIPHRSLGDSAVGAEVETVWSQRAFGVGRP